MRAGPRALRRLQGTVGSRLFSLLLLLQARGCITPTSSSCAHSLLPGALHVLLALCASASYSPLPLRTPAMSAEGLPSWPHLNLIMSAETLFPNNVPFAGGAGVRTPTYLSEGHNSTHNVGFIYTCMYLLKQFRTGARLFSCVDSDSRSQSCLAI